MRKRNAGYTICATALALASGFFGYEETAAAPAKPLSVPAGSGTAVKASLKQTQTARAETYIFDAYETLRYPLPERHDGPGAGGGLAVGTIEELQTGDIVYFGAGSQINERGIYIGNGEYVNEAESRSERTVQSISAELDETRFLGARRILTDRDKLRIKLILDAGKYIGTPYVYGAPYGQTNTFDCSSFTKTVYDQNGITLPRVSRDQARLGRQVAKGELKAGDLVFFTDQNPKGQIGHVGIYAGEGMMIHTYQDKGVTYSSIQNNWWGDHYVTARRIIE